MEEHFEVKPVAWVSAQAGSDDKDDFWGGHPSVIELDPAFGEEALAGLDAFSHIEIVFVFHGVEAQTVCEGVRHPRGNEAWPRVGIFAQRGKRRPNRLGLSRCHLLRVEGRKLYVEGLDARDGTPVLDIKPWMAEFGVSGEVRQPDWSVELMRDYYRVARDSGGE